MEYCVNFNNGINVTLICFLPHYEDSQEKKWQRLMKDPVYDMFKGQPDLDQILKLFPRQQGKAAFDPEGDTIKH